MKWILAIAFCLSLFACGKTETITKMVVQSKYTTSYIPFVRYTTNYTYIYPNKPSVLTGNSTIIEEIAFPSLYSGISNVAFDKKTSTYWMLADNSSAISKIINMNSNGNLLSTTTNNSFGVNYSSSLAHDGSNLWATSYGWVNGVPQSYVYKIDTSTGNIISQLPCPSTQTGFCEGLAWDGAYFWTAASTNKNLVKFDSSGTVIATYVNAFGAVSNQRRMSSDGAGKLMVFDGYSPDIFVFDTTTGAQIQTITNGLYGFGTACWDGALVWRTNASTLNIDVINLGVAL